MASKNQTARKSELQKLKSKVESGKRRISELDLIILPNLRGQHFRQIKRWHRYSRMASMYENERRELIETISKSEQELKKAEQQNIDMRLLLLKHY